MPYEVLEQKIRAIPAEYMEEFSIYVDSFLVKVHTATRHAPNVALASLNALLALPKRIPAGTDYKKEYADYLEEKYGRIG